MKKLLLFAAGAMLAAQGVDAQGITEPTVLPNMAIVKVSPNGKWAINTDPYTLVMSLVNLETGDMKSLVPDENDPESSYDPGIGSCITDDGLVVLSTSYTGTAATWDGNNITLLPMPESATSGFSNAITPDGSRICGSVGMGMTLEDKIMQIPAVRTRLSDGTYSEPTILPYPKTDFTGRTPQYILLQSISDDGKTIAGQVIDYSGYLACEPLIYREDEDGNWTYEKLHPELLNPNNVTLPEYPGEFESQKPEPADFMSPENAEAYNTAISNWNWQDGTPYPDAADYMTDEQWTAYETALAAYEEEYSAWNEKYLAFENAIFEMLDGALTFSMNSSILSGNGRYYATGYVDGSMFFGYDAAYPVIFDLVTGEYLKKELEDVPVVLSYANSNGAVMGSSPAMEYSMRSYNAFIAPSYAAEVIPFQDYVLEKDTELHAWMEENMCHSFTYYDETGNEVQSDPVWTIGLPTANKDLTLFASWNLNEWDQEDLDHYSFSYIIPAQELSGIGNVVAGEGKSLTVSMGADGVVSINGDAAELTVYDVNGRVVFSVKSPASTVSTGLANGVYMVKATDAAGKNVVVKAVI